MKYIKRILMLPFAWVLWTFYYSFAWVKNGGEVNIYLSDKPVIDPKELMSLLRDLNTNICTLIEETK
ncbi:MAG: hypothetical protein M0R17_04295 [Candidatus Omnitrophica bacterium]|jgi:hypothetical protein|nr:hypothetical protein [Candidatus Omnitrophota bacterium]